MLNHSVYILLAAALLYFKPAIALLELELNQGMDQPVPLVVYPFSGYQLLDSSRKIDVTVRQNLRNSGEFDVLTVPQNHMLSDQMSVRRQQLQQWGGEYLVSGQITELGDHSYRVDFELMDDLNNQAVLKKQFQVKEGELRRLAHRVSDLVYEHIVGIPGNFSTRMACVVVEGEQHPTYRLQIVDADGRHPQTLLTSHEPLMSPSWSPDGKRLAYVSFEKKQAEIYLIDIQSGRRTVVSQFPGINGAPAWSPDGKRLAIVLSKSGTPKIYLYDLASRRLEQLTRGAYIDTEPAWSQDGKAIYFTSNRGGQPQIYRVSLSDRRAQRITYQGRYNLSPAITPDDQYLVYLGRNKGRYNLYKMHLSSRTVQQLTHDDHAEAPSIAPNGKIIVYSSYRTARNVLNLVSINGKIKLSLPYGSGHVQEPSWGPLLS